ncbi:MAG TPA: hypothetical protein DEG12_03340 [Alistipes sp.]|uniref:Uncharacterized protein n=1 Tax=Alistipes putredinis TaxID=28117 RepID=A0A1Q6F3B4_9BACT|nr:MAG: hypothetical protein BHV66_09465 [Alistipes putredinis]HBO85736.1 hypothetical protein [Alistipes sp.]HBW11047.1 hypothetical protein [Alistipes sp.]HCF09865.1 hypothetical protein [Alistipes sp.]
MFEENAGRKTMKTNGKRRFPTFSSKSRTPPGRPQKRLNELQVFAEEGQRSGFARTARTEKRLY